MVAPSAASNVNATRSNAAVPGAAPARGPRPVAVAREAAPAASTPSTADQILAQVQQAAAPFKGRIAAAVDQLDGTPDEGDRLRQLYEKTAAQIVPNLDPNLDEALGKAQLAALQKQAKMLPDNDPLTVYLQGVVDRVAGPDTRYKYKVRVIDAPDVNAFNAGGSTMVVFTGLLKTVQNEAELAGVLGHEMTHGENRDVMAKAVIQALAKQAGDEVSARHPVSSSHGVLNFFKNLGKSGAAIVGFDKVNFEAQRDITRSIEARADEGGAARIAKAGYDPHAMSGWFQRMAPTLDKPPSGLMGMLQVYMNDHPTSADRVTAIEAQIKRDKLDQGKKDTGADRYLAATKAYREAPAQPPKS